jgi:hypothetical protein
VFGHQPHRQFRHGDVRLGLHLINEEVTVSRQLAASGWSPLARWLSRPRQTNPRQQLHSAAVTDTKVSCRPSPRTAGRDLRHDPFA